MILKAPLKSEPIGVRLNGVSLKSSIYSAFRGRIIFLSSGLKLEKVQISN